MTDPKKVIPYPEVRDSGLADWRWLLGILHARFKTGSFVKGLELANRIGEAAEEANHHPDLDLSYPDARRAAGQPRRRRRHQPRPRPGAPDQRDRRRARRGRGAGRDHGARDRARRPGAGGRQRLLGGGARLRACAATARQVDRPRRPADDAVVPATRTVPPGRCSSASTYDVVVPARGRPGADRRGDRRGRHAGQRRARRRRSGCWPTGTATRPASARPRAGTSEARRMARLPYRIVGRCVTVSPMRHHLLVLVLTRPTPATRRPSLPDNRGAFS